MDCLTDLFYSEKYCCYRNAASLVGLLFLARLGLRLLCDMCSGFRAFFLSPLGIGRANLLKYGKWAVVTGASEGIGRGYALEKKEQESETKLARRGLNVVLMSRSKDKLDLVANEIKDKYNRECRVIPVDFSAGLDIYSDISDQLSGLDVGVLVNNVGMSYEYGDKFGNLPAERFYKLVHLNCHPVVQMTRVVLPKMVQQGGGYIINVSSTAALVPVPQLFVYSASKKFVHYISDGLRKEYGDKGIKVQTVIPSFVSTAMTGNRRASFFVRTPISYARAAVATIGIQKTTFGCFPHALQGYIFEKLPTFVTDRIMNNGADASRAKFFRKQKKK